MSRLAPSTAVYLVWCVSGSPCLVDHIDIYGKWITGLVDRKKGNGYWITGLVDRRNRNGCWIAQNIMTWRQNKTYARPEGRSPSGSFQTKTHLGKQIHILVLVHQLLSRVRIRTVIQTKIHVKTAATLERTTSCCLAGKTKPR